MSENRIPYESYLNVGKVLFQKNKQHTIKMNGIELLLILFIISDSNNDNNDNNDNNELNNNNELNKKNLIIENYII